MNAEQGYGHGETDESPNTDAGRSTMRCKEVSNAVGESAVGAFQRQMVPCPVLKLRIETAGRGGSKENIWN